MQRSFVHLVGFTAVLLACGTEAPQPGAADSAVAATTEARPDAAVPVLDAGRAVEMNPATAAAQCDPIQCERRANDLAQSLLAPAELSLSVKGGDCARVEIVGLTAGMACTCQSSNGWLYVGPEGAGCFARGRAGDCLWDDSEFEACTVGDPSCPAICDELHKRYAADAAKTFDVEIRYVTCQDGACHHVLRIEDTCYADHSFEAGRRFDCELSDSEILEREARAQKSAR